MRAALICFLSLQPACCAIASEAKESVAMLTNSVKIKAKLNDKLKRSLMNRARSGNHGLQLPSWVRSASTSCCSNVMRCV